MGIVSRRMSETIHTQKAHRRLQHGTGTSDGRAQRGRPVLVPGPGRPVHRGLPHAQHHTRRPLHEVPSEPGERVRCQQRVKGRARCWRWGRRC